MRHIVISGWAFPPEILKPVFGKESMYVDINPLMPRLIDAQGVLDPEWPEKVFQEVRGLVPDEPFGLAGWSTGAIVAFALQPLLAPVKTVLISATPSFCSRPNFEHGWDPRALKAMKRKLLSDRETVLKEFCVRCEIPSDEASRIHHPTETLRAGLDFLVQASLLPLSAPPQQVMLFLHGDRDDVVPAMAGEFFADAVGGEFRTLPAGHGCFLAPSASITELLQD